MRKLGLETIEKRILLAADISYLSPLVEFSIHDPNTGLGGNDYVEVTGDFVGTTNKTESVDIIDFTAEPGVYAPELHGDDTPAILDKAGNVLYPINSTFGFVVEDFVGAEEKSLDDGVFREGWVGNAYDGNGQPIGLVISNVETDGFKSTLPIGTWAAGLGGNTVKASTEHYVVMSNLLGLDGDPTDDEYRLIVDGEVQDTPLTVSDVVGMFENGDVDPNESTVMNDLFVAYQHDPYTGEIQESPSYSVTFKDDGKLLYRWGTLVKRPNDIRIGVHVPLPEEWLAVEDGQPGYVVTQAELQVRHTITNNPNDQIRPEDLENEIATGRIPSYRVTVSDPSSWGVDGWDESFAWRADGNDYSGDGSYLPSYLWLDAEGEVVYLDASDPQAPEGYPDFSLDDLVYVVPSDNSGTPIADVDGDPQLITMPNELGEDVAVVGLRNKEVVVTEDVSGAPVTEIISVGTTFRDTALANPEGISEDIVEGFTWQWYTTMDRDPFEYYYGDDGSLVSGPRWRLLSNKFGQDIPGMEIPLEPGSEPPFQSDNIKYEVGAETVTTIDLLDGAGLLDNGVDLRDSNHWVFTVLNDEGINERDPDNDGVSVNGLPLTDGFDFAFYVKGDQKPATLFDAQLILTYELAEGVDAFDYGDAPVSYESDPDNDLAEPARAKLLVDPSGTPVYYLGVAENIGIDAEANAISTQDALGDDGVNLDDEEGIVFHSAIIPGADTRIDVDAYLRLADGNSTVDPDGGYLYAWIDANLDGLFDPDAERIQFRVPTEDPEVTEVVDQLQLADGGFVNIAMLIPAEAVAGESYIRFRLSPVGPDEGIQILPTGELGDETLHYGEVEDYQVRITDRIDDVISRRTDGSWWVSISDGDVFKETRYGGWTDGVEWTNVMVAELNGEGADDIVGWNPETQNWMTSVTTYVDDQWSFDDSVLNVTGSPPAVWDNAMPVDFNGDGIDEIVGRDASGTWYLASYDGSFTDDMSNVPWSEVYEHIMVGDYNGDAREDIVGRRYIIDDNGEDKVQWVVISYTADDTGTDVFRSEPWETLIDNDQTNYSHVLTGDVTGDGRDDIVARIASSGSWVLTESRISDSGSEQFKTKGWGGSIPNEPILDVMIGDVDADGDEDVIARNINNQWWVKVADGTESSNATFGQWSTSGTFVDVCSGDFNGDGLIDVAGRDDVDAKWTVGLSDGMDFEFQPFGSWNQNEVWTNVMVGDFNWIGEVVPPTPSTGDDGGDGGGSGGNQDADGDAVPGAGLQRLTPAIGEFDGDIGTDYISQLHTFSIDDVLGGYDGGMYVNDPSIIDTAGVGDVEPIVTKEGVTLYPIDSTFGFHVLDFVGGEEKVNDGIYTEGWVGNLDDGNGNAIGMQLSDADTVLFKSGLPLGTWLTGLGGDTVKASTEHYRVMADILGFDESPSDDTFVRIDLAYDEATGVYTPTEGIHGTTYSGAELVAAFNDGLIEPNESSVLKDIFVAFDVDEDVPIYSVTFKDDGKLLYRWGTAVKRPNDIRLNASLPLPQAWTETGLTYHVTTANLRVNHAVTNNPNDQIRPEDLENEEATGRTPEYQVIGNYQVVANPADASEFLWVSDLNDYAGNGTYYPSYFLLDENGNIVPPTDATPEDLIIHDLNGNEIGVKNQIEVVLSDGSTTIVDGTIFRDSMLIEPDGISSDLTGGFTNAWFTTMNRDPFEPNAQYARELFETVNNVDDEYLVLNVPGPRWRLQAGKFGQDLPGVDIPLIPQSRPPFTKYNIKYPTGGDTTTIINLLDGAGVLDNGVDLRESTHWVGLVRDFNGVIIDERLAVDDSGALITRDDGGSTSYLTVNGAWLSEGFDFSVYIKGDKKPASLYDSQLVLEYEIDVSIQSQPNDMIVASLGQLPDVTEDPDVTYEWYVDGLLVTSETDGSLDLQVYLDSQGLGAGVYFIELYVTDVFGTVGYASLNQPNNLRQFIVNTTSDTHDALLGDGIALDGDGFTSLRAAIEEANFLANLDVIQFDIPGDGPQVISLSDALPTVIDPIFVDGSTQPSYASTPLIGLEGATSSLSADGLQFSNTAAGSSLIGLAIYGFGGDGIEFNGGAGNTVTDCFLGLDPNGMALGNGLSGAHVVNSSDNTIDANVIAANGTTGIIVNGVLATANVITSNKIGTSPDGSSAVPNSQNGVSIINAPDTIIGLVGQGNVISGNGSNGVSILGSTAVQTIVHDNIIGLNARGYSPLPNQANGIIASTADNSIGGSGAGQGNTISGNNQYGIYLAGTGATGNFIQGNSIGTDLNGATDIGNLRSGVLINAGTSNTVGGTLTGAGNLISGNDQHGVYLLGAGATANLVQGNLIGTDIDGETDLGNTRSGVLLNGAVGNTVGGIDEGAGNVISGNDQFGVYLLGAGATANLVQGNLIGTDINGTETLGNLRSGVMVSNAHDNTIGGTTVEASNVISGNDQCGVYLSGADATGNLVQGNYIGTDPNGTADIGNLRSGVLINAAASNTVGGTDVGAGNVISGNDQHGVYLLGTDATANLVQGNLIGTDSNGTAALGNLRSGVFVNNAPDNTIGGATPAASNVISGNDQYGVYLLARTLHPPVVDAFEFSWDGMGHFGASI
ncbi:GEVED domain-containing protein [Planctomycetes bacterium CA13]|uniref:GEVED domain-containing protein n=1 Tax=Novipirellula herctigrandis TaxID=2527986 RepID=UPI0011B4076B